MKILVIEDELELLAGMVHFLKNSGVTAIGAGSLFEAEDKLIMHQFDLVVLDLSLPDGSGLSFIQTIKNLQSDAAILIVSAKNALDDRLSGLDLGADDYLTKPFHLAELLSRINAILRRKKGTIDQRLVFNELVIHLDEHQVYVYDQLIELTRKEYELLFFFITNKNRVLTKESIAQHLWGEGIELADNFDFIYTRIKNLRKKITDQQGKDYLKTVYGMGYKFTDL